MLRYRKREITLAIGLSTLAGYVDAIGFLSLGGFFVSFMSGNSTRLAVGVAGMPAEALIAARLIGCFLLGVILGSLIGRATGSRRQSAVLAAVAATLAAAAATAGAGLPEYATMLVAMAMGAENTTFERDGEVAIGLTYMTGSLVKLGQRIAGALTGGPKVAWVPYLGLWLGFIGGAVIGALAWPSVGLAGLWFAALAALGLSVAAWMIARSRDAGA
jgi:uncharacterized membrane protein YoaK (UPF0700 family)